jgi:hypothetical protein
VIHKSACEWEFPKFMSYHIFSDEYWYMWFSIMYTKCVSYEFWSYCTCPRPCTYYCFFTRRIEDFDFFHESLVDVWSFFETACHIVYSIRMYKNYPWSFPALVRSIHLSVLLRERVFVPRADLPHGVFGPFLCPTDWWPSPHPCGWSTVFIEDPRTVGRTPIQRLRPAFPIVIWLWSVFDTVPIFA